MPTWFEPILLTVVSRSASFGGHSTYAARASEKEEIQLVFRLFLRQFPRLPVQSERKLSLIVLTSILGGHLLPGRFQKRPFDQTKTIVFMSKNFLYTDPK